jgi:hypothetical protein
VCCSPLLLVVLLLLVLLQLRLFGDGKSDGLVFCVSWYLGEGDSIDASGFLPILHIHRQREREMKNKMGEKRERERERERRPSLREIR